jgi:hypothetical protein
MQSFSPPETENSAISKDELNTAQTYTCEARRLQGQVATEGRWRRLGASNLCGGFDPDGALTRWCITYGLFAATLSAIEFINSSPSGSRGGRLVSVFVPYAGLRVIPFVRVPFLSFDFTLYSAFITSAGIDSTPASTPCGGGGNALLRNLPCESNPKIQPYAAMLAGVTFGKDNIGYLTLAPLTLGVASVGSLGAYWYAGALAGTLQLTGRF